MKRLFAPARRVSLKALALAAFAFAPALASAATATVPYVPTPQEVVDRMLDIAKVTKNDYLIDLGSGDGRIVITAAKKYGARGFGVDLNPTRIAEANANAQKAGVTDRVSFVEGDLFETDLSLATVITMYLLPRVNMDLRPKILDLKPGTRVVSHDFDMGDWQPDQHEELEVKQKYGNSPGRSDIYFWIVPGKVAGTWRSQLRVHGKPIDYEFTLQQQFQFASGTARVAGQSVAIQNARLRGDQITFNFTVAIDGEPTRHTFTGTLTDGSIVGNADISGPHVAARLDWNAKRTP